MSVGTTLTTAMLIWWRIQSVGRLDGQLSNKMFGRIIVLIIESAATYSLMLFIDAILAVVPSFSSLDSIMIDVKPYVQALLTAITMRLMLL